MTTNHTPTPWRIGDAGHTVFGPPNGNPSPKIVAYDLMSNDARLIVQAVNSHTALVEALLALETAAKTVYNDPYSTCRCADTLREPLTQARAALALANT